MKRPIPAPIALRKLNGIAFTMASRTLVRVSKMNTSPSMSTAVRANCHEYPIPRQTVYTKKALRPIPGASPNGSFPMNAIARQPTIAAIAVEVKTAPPGMPSSWLKRDGLTARMYDIVRKVVIPATISLRIVVCDGLNPKSLVNIF